MLYGAWRKRRYWPDSPACYGLRPIIERIATMPVTSRYLRLTLYTVLILVGAVVAGGWAMQQAKHHALEESARRGPEQLSLYANSLHTLIERYRALPAVLAQDPELIAALAGHVTPEVQAQLNRKLERINGAAQSSTLELLDSTGLAVAASNWNTSNSYVGHNYGFRPYFSQTRSQGTGRFYAVGVTSGIPGYFLSSAVHDSAGRFLGAIVVKLEFPELEREWSQGSDTLLVSDARDIVFIANQPGWRYRHLRPLNDSDRDNITVTRQYDKQPLTLMPTRTLRVFDDNSFLTQVDGPDGPTDYLWGSLPLKAEGWTLHLLRKPPTASEDGRNAALAAVGLWLTLVFLGLFLSNAGALAACANATVKNLNNWSKPAPVTCAPRKMAWCNRPNSRRWGRCRRRWPTKSISRSPPSACNWPPCACCLTTVASKTPIKPLRRWNIC